MDVFVYGTLTDPTQVGRVLDSFVFVGPATLSGLHAVDGTYPTLAPGGRTAGRLLRTEAVGALDDYERVDEGVYTRVTVPLEGGPAHPDAAQVYVGDPGRLDVAADIDWTVGDGDVDKGSDAGGESDIDHYCPVESDDHPREDPADFPERVRDYVASEDVSIVVERES